MGDHGAEAVLGDPGHRLGVTGGVPERRIGLLEGLEGQRNVTVAVVAALEIQVALAKALEEDVERLSEHGAGLGRVNSEACQLVR